MQTDNVTIQAIRNNGWRQGSILRNTNESGKSKLNKGLYMLLSQDCDICHSSIEDEPHIEIIRCKLTNGEPDGNLTYGKNPRRLLLQLNDKNYYELHARDRQFIRREILANTSSDNELQTPEKALTLVINWIKKRVDRDAFPFEFDERFTRKNRDKLKKLLQNCGKNILGIFIRLNSMEELPPEKKYILDLIMLINHDESDRTSQQKTLEKIYELLNSNTGIEVLSRYRMLSPEEISLAEFMTLQELDHDYISFRDADDSKSN